MRYDVRDRAVRHTPAPSGPAVDRIVGDGVDRIVDDGVGRIVDDGVDRIVDDGVDRTVGDSVDLTVGGSVGPSAPTADWPIAAAPESLVPLLIEHKLIREVIDRIRIVRGRADRLPAMNLLAELVETMAGHERTEDELCRTLEPDLRQRMVVARGAIASELRTCVVALAADDLDPLGTEIDGVLDRIEAGLVDEEAILFELFAESGAPSRHD